MNLTLANLQFRYNEQDNSFIPKLNFLVTEARAASAVTTDPTIVALAAYNTNGLLTQTAADTFTGRTLTGPATGITVTNGNGVAGNPTLALANDLAALEALSGTNTIYYRSAADTWTAVTIGGLLSFSAGTLNIGDAELSAIAGLTSAADKAPYFTGSGTAALADFTSVARTLVAQTTQALMRSTGLGLGTSSTVDTGTSGTKVPLLDAANTWALAQTFSANPSVAGGGIAFPATQVPSADANTLDDYEEGTFTPTLLFGGAATGMAFSTQLGRYTKIGQRVFIDIRLTLTAKGSSTGSATIGGLPFTTGALPQSAGAFLVNVVTTVAMPVFIIGNGVTTIGLFDFTASALAGMNDTDFNNTTLLLLSTSYTV